MTSMIAQILLLVMATAAGINAYPHGAELAQDLASVLNQLQTAGSQQDTGNSQQSLSRCAPFPFHVTFNGVTYEFRDCVVMGRICQYNRAKFPKTCHSSTFACYSIEWRTNGYGIQRFKMCPTAGGACIRNFGLMRCGDKIEEAVQQQNIRLCQENPDGTEDCTGDEKAVQQQDWEQECFCITGPDGEKVCEPSGCNASIMA